MDEIKVTDNVNIISGNPNADINAIAKSLAIDSLIKDEELYKAILTAAVGGNNKIADKVIMQSMKIDADWIESIENGLFSIEQIIKKPKVFIKEDRQLVNVEKAKRVDGVAVRHLSTHTEYIKEIRSDGTIRPSKIMTRQLDEDIAIYENRFIYALILRLQAFIDRRYDTIKTQSKVKDNNVLNMKSTFKLGKADVDYSLMLNVRVPGEDKELSDANDELLEKLDLIRQRIAILNGTKFVQIMRGYKLVTAPIMKTNILSGNVDYKNCYNLWLMLSSYNSVGYRVNIKEKELTFDDAYFDDLAKIAAASVETVLVNNDLRKSLNKKLNYTEVNSRKYRKVKEIVLQLDNGKSTVGDTDGIVNQYYYQKIKRMYSDISGLSTANDNEKEIAKVNFRRFFKGIEKINNEMYLDVLKIKHNASRKGKTSKTCLAELKKQKKVAAKLALLTQLKRDEVKLAERKEEAQERRMKALQYEADRLKGKEMREKMEKDHDKAVAKAQKKARKSAAVTTVTD